MKELICHDCGRAFLYHRKKKYCSSQCRLKTNRRRRSRVQHEPRPCVKCGVVYTPKKARGKRCANCYKLSQSCVDCGRPRAKGTSRCELCRYIRKAGIENSGISLVSYIDAPCLCCGEMMSRPENNQPRKWCSNRCRNLGKHGTKAECVECGSEFTRPRNKPEQKYCSVNCFSGHIRKEVYPVTDIKHFKCEVCSRSAVMPSSQRGEVCRICRGAYPEHRRRSIVTGILDRKCQICGVHYCALPGYGRVITCSHACHKESEKRHRRAHRAKRRSQSRGGESFDPFEIFKRDGWKCQHCGCKTPIARRGSIHPRAPELDHIVPLSKGGKHTRANTQLLCRDCNIKKGNGSGADQMLLFG